MSIWYVPAKVWRLARNVEDLLASQGQTRTALEAVAARLRSLEDRMVHLEAGQGQLIGEAKAAAGIAATGLAGSVISDVVTRLTRVEMLMKSTGQALPAPGRLSDQS